MKNRIRKTILLASTLCAMGAAMCACRGAKETPEAEKQLEEADTQDTGKEEADTQDTEAEGGRESPGASGEPADSTDRSDMVPENPSAAEPPLETWDDTEPDMEGE